MATVVEDLEQLLPELNGRIYTADYQDLSMILRKLKSTPDTTMLDLINGYTTNLRGILDTGELYQRNPDSRRLLQKAIGILDKV